MTDLTRETFVARMLDLGRRHGEIPIYGSDQWEQLDPVDPRRFASVVRAAECWRLESEPDAVRRRLAEDDALVQLRIRLASLDVSAATDWSARASLTPIAELQRLRLYGTEVA